MPTNEVRVAECSQPQAEVERGNVRAAMMVWASTAKTVAGLHITNDVKGRILQRTRREPRPAAACDR